MSEAEFHHANDEPVLAVKCKATKDKSQKKVMHLLSNKMANSAKTVTLTTHLLLCHG